MSLTDVGGFAGKFLKARPIIMPQNNIHVLLGKRVNELGEKTPRNIYLGSLDNPAVQQ